MGKSAVLISETHRPAGLAVFHIAGNSDLGEFVVEHVAAVPLAGILGVCLCPSSCGIQNDCITGSLPPGKILTFVFKACRIRGEAAASIRTGMSGSAFRVVHCPGLFCADFGSLFESGVPGKCFQSVGSHFRRIARIPVPLIGLGGTESIEDSVCVGDRFVTAVVSFAVSCRTVSGRSGFDSDFAG